MPTIGSFHAKYWKAKAGTPPPPVAGPTGMYAQWQSVVTTPHMITFVPPLGYLVVLGAVIGRGWRFLQAEWRWWRRIAICRRTADGVVVLDRVVTMLESDTWADAQTEVQACASSPKFHQPEQWVAYSRIVKSNPGQAQNIWRHMKVVQALQATDPNLSNANAHLLAELAYQGHADRSRRTRAVKG